MSAGVAGGGPAVVRPIRHLRWWIGGMLFASTVINYVDRQTLTVLSPFLKDEFQWTNEDYALIVIAFRVAYAFGMTALGRLMDRVGTRMGLAVTVACYSVVSIFTSLASGLRSFIVFRFLLALAESPNWPAATKTVAEWFPKQERGWAVALFDSGSSIGAAIAPALVIWLYHSFGGWRPAFLITGALGFVWIVGWMLLYRKPEEHPRLGAEERAMILADRAESETSAGTGAAVEAVRPGMLTLLRQPQTWGTIVARSFSDPVWFFVTDWFMLFLVAKGFTPESTLIAFWIPFIAADLGNFAGGGVSSWLIRRGWSVATARKTVVFAGALGMMMLLPATLMTNLFAIAGLFGVATFSYAAYSTMAIVLPADIFRSGSVATVSGMCGTAAQTLTIGTTFLIGRVSEHHSFTPVLVVGSMVPLIGAVLVLILVRNPKGARPSFMREI